MRYLYRSYCLKEGGIWSGCGDGKKQLLNQRQKNKEKSEKSRTLIEKKSREWKCRRKFEQLGLFVKLGAVKLGGAGRWGKEGGLHGWTHISLRYLHILAKEYYKAGAERALSISWWRAERPPPPRALAHATGRWVSWGWPACRTSGAAPSPSC